MARCWAMWREDTFQVSCVDLKNRTNNFPEVPEGLFGNWNPAGVALA